MPVAQTMKRKRKSPVALSLDDGLEKYLRAKAKENYRSITSEIAMRLEQSRAQEQQPQGAQQ